jgi:hypothetical protein
MLLLPACWLVIDHPTPEHALTQLPGEVLPENADSVRILRQQNVADHLAVVYRWQTERAEAQGTYCVASAFITREGQGWRAQSSRGFVGDRAMLPKCDFAAPLGLKANFYNSGYDGNSISLVYGVSDVGTHVRITWADGHVETQPLENNAVLFVRADLVEPTLVEALNDAGEVQARETFTYQ